MSERNDNVYLQDIVDSIQAIEAYTLDITEHDFIDNQLLQDAVTRRFEIIGEAATHMSDSFKDKHPSIEWRLMGDMRNKLIHEYFGANPITIYQTIQKDLPGLKAKILLLI